MNRVSARNVFSHQTGRVIALGRAGFAALFFAATWLDSAHLGDVAGTTVNMLALYALFALAITVATWRNWWLDARLAAPATVVDIAMFVFVVFSTDGYTSPFYLLFTLPLLTAAIRWTWRETAQIAAVLIILYLAAGIFVAGTGTFEMQRFVIRSGHLLILSVLLIWFGGHPRGSRNRRELPELAIGEHFRDNPVKMALETAAARIGARRGWLLLRDSDDQPLTGLALADGSCSPAVFQSDVLAVERVRACRLFDLERNRALGRGEANWFEFRTASDSFDRSLAIAAGLREGLVAPVSTDTVNGVLILDTIANLSTDYIDMGNALGLGVATFLGREALAEAAAIGAGTRERLSLARDVHDSLVQFLAGAAFRVEAMARAARRGVALDVDLAELKRLIVDEQRDMREFVSALRREQDVVYDEAVEELSSLADKLSKQWTLDCRITAAPATGTIPIRLHLDVRQLLREAVANAARHGSATRVEVEVALGDGRLDLRFVDDGQGFPPVADGVKEQPWSLKERVDRAGGDLNIESSEGRTAIAVVLPLEGVGA